MAGKPSAEAPAKAAPVFNNARRLQLPIDSSRRRRDVVLSLRIPACENVKGVLLLLDDISGRRRRCQRQMRPADPRCSKGSAFDQPLAPNSAERRFAAACTDLARPCKTWPVIRQIGPEMPSAPITSPVKLKTGTATQRTSELNSPSSKATALRRTSAISRSNTD